MVQFFLGKKEGLIILVGINPIFYSMKPILCHALTMAITRRGVMLVLLIASVYLLPAQTIYYIQPLAAGTGTGLSWSDAAGGRTTSNHHQLGAFGSQVWVAAGTYYPQAIPAGSISGGGGLTNRDYAFTLPELAYLFMAASQVVKPHSASEIYRPIFPYFQVTWVLKI